MNLSAMLRGLVSAAVISVLMTGSAQAQQWTPRADEAGWIGISFQVDEDRWGETSSVTITDVSRGSPADEAGGSRGDGGRTCR
jgi:C-terminal processing protease CtpA/Prc